MAVGHDLLAVRDGPEVVVKDAIELDIDVVVSSETHTAAVAVFVAIAVFVTVDHDVVVVMAVGEVVVKRVADVADVGAAVLLESYTAAVVAVVD